MILYYDGKRIGCSEVKKDHNIHFKLLESDRARIAETMKRQLRVRIMASKSEKEMITFGIFCSGHTIELYIMSFNSKAEVPYQLYKIQTLKIPTSLSTYTHIEESLEYLKSFKVSNENIDLARE